MKHPTVVAIAKKFLVVHATLDSSKIIISRVRRIISTDRNRLDPITVGSLLHISENSTWCDKMIDDINYDEVSNLIFP